MQQLLLDIRPPALPDLAHFVVGRNHELMTQLQAMLQNRASERMVYLWGAPSCGKTYLLQAWTQACRSRGWPVATSSQNEAEVVVTDHADEWDETQQLAAFAAYNHVREAGGLWLSAGYGHPESFWGSDKHFVFVRSVSSSLINPLDVAVNRFMCCELRESPIGITIRPPGASCSIKGAGNSGPPAVTMIA